MANRNDLKIMDTLRPRRLQDYIGQTPIKESLKVFIEATQKRGEPLSHVLIHGGPGLGKTTLANIIARELNANIRITSGPAIERTGDLAALLSNLQPGDVLFIDEIHRLNRNIEEVMYPAMEDFALDIVIGKGPSAKTLRLELPKFTLVGATTRIGALSSPLRERFGVVYNLEFYSSEEMEAIIARSAKILAVAVDQEGIKIIASRARRTPRVANRLLARARDFAQVKHTGTISGPIADQALQMLEIDELGLDPSDRRVLKVIAEKFSGGPVGVNTIAAACAQEKQTIEEVIEPYLIQIGFLDRTPKGRKITSAALSHLGLAPRGML